ncbi:hypothetical protein ACFE04_005253 [Oxalis oulophora]
MQALSRGRRLAGVLKSATQFRRFLKSQSQISISPIINRQCEAHNRFNGSVQRNFTMQTASFSTEASAVEVASTDTVKELYDKIIESVNVKRTMSPNAWLWSLIADCKNKKDIELLFDVLKNLHIFRLSNLRIHDNFNCALCRDIAKACARVGALEFGKKTLWLHNMYGLSPSVASANHLLTYAKNHKDAKLMEEVMKLMKRNDLPLQPSTADLVFSICYDTDNWDLISKYSKRFIRAGIKLREMTFGTWMQFAALRGDTESLWKIEELRAESMKQHSLSTGLSCAKGFLLERKPEDAATVIQLLNQVLAASLQSDIPAMVSDLLNMGLEVKLSLRAQTMMKAVPLLLTIQFLNQSTMFCNPFMVIGGQL